MQSIGSRSARCCTALYQGVSRYCFTYVAPKYVSIRDWKVGLAYLLMKLLIVCYIFGWLVCWKGEHLKDVPSDGFGRVTLTQPTVSDCNFWDSSCSDNFTNVRDLPYCSQYSGSSSALWQKRQPCEYFDAREFGNKAPEPGGFFLPTQIMQVQVDGKCNATYSNGWACERKLQLKDSTYQTHYVADVENFRFLIDHAHVANLGHLVQGSAEDYKGYVVLPTNKSGHCGHDILQIPSEDEERLSAVPSLVIGDFAHGFWITLGDLLRLSDPRGVALLDEHRSSGGILLVDVRYKNDKRFDFLGKAEVRYELSVKRLPITSYTLYSSPHEHFVHSDTGFLVVVHVHGGIREFDPVRALMMLTASAALFGVAGLVVDKIILQLLDFKQAYKILMCQPSMTFHKHRILRSALKEKYGQDYNEAKHKHTLDASLLQDILSREDKTATQEELLCLLARFEHRLNRLDAMDDHEEDAGGAISTFLDEYEEQYWRTREVKLNCKAIGCNNDADVPLMNIVSSYSSAR